MRSVKNLLAAGLSLVVSGSAAAQDAPAAPAPKGVSFDLLAEIGVEYGGDRVAKFEFTNGGTQTMRAGQGGTAAVGVRVRPRRGSPLGVRATAGIKYVTTAADNANITLTRIPLEVVGSYHVTKDVWAGAGYVHHARIRFDGDRFGPDIEFKSANGATVEVGWRWAALTYTALEYTGGGAPGLDASSLGVAAVIPVLRR